MVGARDVWSVLVGVLAFRAVASADLMPVSAPGIEREQSASVRSAVKAQSLDSAFPLDSLSIGGLDLATVQLVPGSGENPGPISETLLPQFLPDSQNSLSLCLSALMGLALCNSPHCMKKLARSAFLAYHHDGSPFQIGHSHVVSTDCLCSAPAYCFVQTDKGMEGPRPQYHQKVIVSLWRKSQFTPVALASRAPPSDAHSRLGCCVRDTA